MHRDEIPTPALLLDADRFERNLARMAAHVRRAGSRLRPHAKPHRCPEIARRQIAAGTLGVACAKLGEAEVMAAGGGRGLLITTGVVPPGSFRRLMTLLGQAPDTMLVVDHPDNVRALARAAAEASVTLNVLVDVHVGARRTGVGRGRPGLAAATAGPAGPAWSRARRRWRSDDWWPSSGRSGCAGCRAMPGSARTSWAGPRATRPR